MKRIGIDVGGTNTDAVLIGMSGVEASVKAATTSDVTGGIVAAMRSLAEREPLGDDIAGVMVGTTHFINAVVQRRSLSKVAAIRIGAPATSALPPFCDWPQELAELVSGGCWEVQGGHDYDGRHFLPLDCAALRRAAREIRARGLRSVAIAGMFSPLDPSHEETAAQLIRDEVPDVHVTCSHQLGRIGLLERENAALMNASLVTLASETVRAFEKAIADVGVSAPLFITQNDGTVAEAERAIALPIYSFASGATNSMRGAAYLSRLDEAIVADVGGTTTDFGSLRHGFPREANAVVRVGGVRTLFRMPDVTSIGLGGGSLVDLDGMTIGPESVGYRLTQEALVFGGSRLTMTDIAVAAGLMEIGDRSRVAHLAPASVDAILARAKTMIEDNVDRMKTSAGDATLIAVGGGSVLIPDTVEGIGKVVRVEHGSCANAVGAAIAQVSGEVDQVFQGTTRGEALAQAERIAKERAVEAGADPRSLRMVEAEDIPIAYLPGDARRVRVRVIGEIKLQPGKATRAAE
jgi:N-methylhydantoinase A/oxoprolinase/acetone carboxylase beta subunit